MMWVDVGERLEVLRRIDTNFIQTVITIPRLQFAAKLQEFLQDSQPDLRLVEEARSQDVFGDIEVFCSHACHPNEQLFTFLRAFCPKLKKLVISCVGDDNERAVFNFFSAPDRKDTLVSLRFLGNHANLLINNKRISELDKLQNDFFVNQQKLSDFPLFIITASRALQQMMEVAPCLTGWDVILYVTDDEEERVDLMRNFAQRYTDLKFLKLNVNISMEDERTFAAVKDIIKNNKKLTTLRISCGYLDRPTENLLSQCENLKSLTVPFVSELFLAKFPVLFPHLQHFTCFHKPISDRALVRLLKDCPELLDISGQSEALGPVAHITRRIFFLHEWNCILKQGKLPWRKLLTMMDDWDKDLLHSLHRLIWIHEGAPDIPEYGRKALASDLSLMKSTKPILSLHGNLINQLAVKECFEAECFLLRTEIGLKKDFVEHLAGGPWKEEFFTLQERVTQILIERHGKGAEDGGKYFCDMMNGDTPEDSQFVSAVFTGEVQVLQAELDQICASYQKNKLQALQILLRDNSMNQTQLFEVYQGLDKDIQDKLAYYVWQANGSPKEAQYGEKRIQQNLRCIDDGILQNFNIIG